METTIKTENQPLLVNSPLGDLKNRLPFSYPINPHCRILERCRKDY